MTTTKNLSNVPKTRLSGKYLCILNIKNNFNYYTVIDCDNAKSSSICDSIQKPKLIDLHHYYQKGWDPFEYWENESDVVSYTIYPIKNLNDLSTEFVELFI